MRRRRSTRPVSPRRFQRDDYLSAPPMFLRFMALPPCYRRYICGFIKRKDPYGY